MLFQLNLRPTQDGKFNSLFRLPCCIETRVRVERSNGRTGGRTIGRAVAGISFPPTWKRKQSNKLEKSGAALWHLSFLFYY